MKRLIITILIAYVFTLLTGCYSYYLSWKKDLSKCKYFDKYVGVKGRLFTEVFLIKDNDYGIYYLEEKKDSLYKDIMDNRLRKEDFDIIRVSNGEEIIINSIYIEQIYAGPQVLYVYGEVYVSRMKKYLSFVYSWSDNKILPRPPWSSPINDEFIIVDLDEDFNCN